MLFAVLITQDYIYYDYVDPILEGGGVIDYVVPILYLKDT